MEIEQRELISNDSSKNKEKNPFIRDIKNSYGENFQEHFLQQYKLYVEMMDKVSERRIKNNTFYISLISSLIAFMSLVSVKIEKFFIDNKILLLLIAILGLLLCYIWYSNINSYKQLNSLKFQVIHEMEKQLPYPCYFREWEILKQGNELQKYNRLNNIEKSVPLLLSIPYFILLIYFLSRFR